MTINYDNILDQLNKKFTLVSREGKNYFLNSENAIVACYDDNSISMFFEYPEYDRQLHTNKGLAVATFVKDFQVNEQIADVIILDGLNGAYNDTKIVGNYAYIHCVNDELSLGEGHLVKPAFYKWRSQTLKMLSSRAAEAQKAVYV